MVFIMSGNMLCSQLPIMPFMPNAPLYTLLSFGITEKISRSRIGNQIHQCGLCHQNTLIHNTICGEWTCNECGYVNSDRIIDNSQYQLLDKHGIDHYQIQHLTYQKKTICFSDRKKIVGKINYERLFRVCDKYETVERKDQLVIAYLRSIVDHCNLDNQVFVAAFKHYRLLQKQNCIYGKRILTVCAVVINFAVKENNIPLDLNTLTERIQIYIDPKFRKGLIVTLKNNILAAGYAFDRAPLPANMRIASAFTRLREHPPLNLTTNTTLLQTEIDAIESKTLHLFAVVQSKIALSSTLSTHATALIYCAARLQNIRLKSVDLARAAGVSIVTFRNHVRFILKYLPQTLAMQISIHKKDYQRYIKIGRVNSL